MMTSRFERLRYYRPSLLFWGTSLLVAILLISLAAPVISPFDPIEQSTGPPLAQPSTIHPLGTDDLGRDVLSRLLHGGMSVIIVASLSVAFAVVVGSVLGLAAAYIGGLVDSVLSRFIDIMLSIPLMLLGITIVVILGPSMSTLIIAIGTSQIPVFMRLTRSLCLKIRREVFVEASQAFGASSIHTIWRHVVPNMLPILLVQASTTVGLAILAATALNYLGFGVQPPAADWGALVSDYQRFVFTRWWMPIAPGAAIALTVLAVSLTSDGIGVRLGVKSRGVM